MATTKEVPPASTAAMTMFSADDGITVVVVGVCRSFSICCEGELTTHIIMSKGKR